MFKKIFLPIFIVAVAVFAISGVNKTLAQNTAPADKSLIQTIAEKFNLSPDEVQKTAEDFRTQKVDRMRTERKARLEKNLTEAVSEGKITEAQKQAILQKTDELVAKKEQERIEMQAWAEKNGLDRQEMKFGFGMFKLGRGFHYWK